jgi:hypothetical protein
MQQREIKRIEQRKLEAQCLQLSAKHTGQLFIGAEDRTGHDSSSYHPTLHCTAAADSRTLIHDCSTHFQT